MYCLIDTSVCPSNVAPDNIALVVKVIDRRDVKLPENWKRFLGMNENKVNLANFLSDQLVEAGQGIQKELVVSGGFKEISKAVSSKRDVPMLCQS